MQAKNLNFNSLLYQIKRKNPLVYRRLRNKTALNVHVLYQHSSVLFIVIFGYHSRSELYSTCVRLFLQAVSQVLQQRGCSKDCPLPVRDALREIQGKIASKMVVNKENESRHVISNNVAL